MLMMSKIMAQNFLCKKDIHLLIAFKAQEFVIILLLQLMRIISADKSASNVSISKIQAPSNITDFMPRTYVACIYDDDWFVGNVTEISEQYNKIHDVKFMKKWKMLFVAH